MIYLKSKLGFSMVEALVAIAVLTIGVITPLSLLANSLANAEYARNQITAFFLAQEGQELIINYRDNRRLDGKISPNRDDQDGSYWLGGLGPCIDVNYNPTEACDIDTQNPTEIIDVETAGSNRNCNLELGCELYLDGRGFYVQDSTGQKTIFHRKIVIIPEDEIEQNNARVIVTISWQDRNKDRKFVLNSIIYR